MPHTQKSALFLLTDPGPSNRARASSRMQKLTAGAALVAALFAPGVMAQADPYAEVNRLIRAGQLSEALVKTDQYLTTKPGDPQMRFLKGVVLTESGKSADAVTTFQRLTEDYPELPEPYNNLAVLYASQSQFDKARAALEMAIRTNPSYATAHENLGDVYAKLASQAYSKALQLDAGNTGVAPKLSLIRNLFSADARSPSADKVAAAPPAATAPAPAAAAAAAAAAAPPAATSPAARDDVAAAVQAWAQAWSSKSMPDYLGAYAPNFTPPGGQARAAWEADRRARIVPRQRISVDVSELEVTVDGDRATARFRQAYASDTLNVNSLKTLDMVKSGSRWLIVRETTGS
jgi:tetratricopeptide (TPR) repeat protein